MRTGGQALHFVRHSPGYDFYYGTERIGTVRRQQNGEWIAVSAKPHRTHMAATRGDAGDWLLKQHLADREEGKP